MSEWSKEHAWKVCIRQKRIEGSNPFLSAKNPLIIKKMKKMYSKLTLATLFFINFGVAFAENTNGGVNQSFKEYFIKGGPAYMAPILLCLIMGLQ